MKLKIFFLVAALLTGCATTFGAEFSEGRQLCLSTESAPENLRFSESGSWPGPANKDHYNILGNEARVEPMSGHGFAVFSENVKEWYVPLKSPDFEEINAASEDNFQLFKSCDKRVCQIFAKQDWYWINFTLSPENLSEARNVATGLLELITDCGSGDRE